MTRTFILFCAAAFVFGAGCSQDNAIAGETSAVSTSDSKLNGADSETWNGIHDTGFPPYKGDTKADAVVVRFPDTIPMPGSFGAKCTQNTECTSGFCVPTENGSACTKICVQDCPDGYRCEQIADIGGDPVYVCISKFTRLCNPCSQHTDCNGGGIGIANKCVDKGADGKFCGVVCEFKVDCPNGYFCKQLTVDGATAEQCVPENNELCECNARAKELKMSTVCYELSSPSTCKGTRVCELAGLSKCNIASKPEKCNGMDDDCDGETDEELCDDGNPCTADSCNTDGSCKHEQLDSTSCDDGSACTLVDKCAFGKCVGGVFKVCDDDNPCTDDKCDPAGGCLFSSNKDVCDDGNPCTLADKCSEKKCIGGPPPNCNDKNPCTTDFCDPVVGCLHKADTKADGVPCASDNKKCTFDKCISGQCAHQPIPGCTE